MADFCNFVPLCAVGELDDFKKDKVRFTLALAEVVEATAVLWKHMNIFKELENIRQKFSVKVSKSQKHFFLKLHRAEFCLIFHLFFEQWSFKKNCFWDLLTFSKLTCSFVCYNFFADIAISSFNDFLEGWEYVALANRDVTESAFTQRAEIFSEVVFSSLERLSS